MKGVHAGAVPDHGPQATAPPCRGSMLNRFDDDEWKFLSEFSQIMGDIPPTAATPTAAAATPTPTAAPGNIPDEAHSKETAPSVGSTCTSRSSLVDATTHHPYHHQPRGGEVQPAPADAAPQAGEVSSWPKATPAVSPSCVQLTATVAGQTLPQLQHATLPVTRERGTDLVAPALQALPQMGFQGPYMALPRPALPVRRKSRKPQKKFKNYSMENPSRFCHICAKNRLNQPSLVCTNVKKLLCQKAVCRKCFYKRGWDWDAANAPNSEWLCPHCRGECPKQARCHVYSKANKRRSERKAQTAAEAPDIALDTSLIVPHGAEVGGFGFAAKPEITQADLSQNNPGQGCLVELNDVKVLETVETALSAPRDSM